MWNFSDIQFWSEWVRECLTVASLSDVDIKNGVGCVKRYTSDWTHSFTSENLHSIRLYASLLLQRIISKQCNNLAIIFNKPLKIWVINESFGCLTVSKRLWASSDFHKKIEFWVTKNHFEHLIISIPVRLITHSELWVSNIWISLSDFNFTLI